MACGKWRHFFSCYSGDYDFGALVVYKIATSLVNRTFNRKFSWQSQDSLNHRGVTLGRLINSMIKYVLIFIVIVVILSKLGVNVASIIATAGVLGLAVSFGAQTLVKDVISVSSLLWKINMGWGEYVSINQNQGNCGSCRNAHYEGEGV